ncbi:unnamed protein product [Prorocentrum cordatum]|uniref:Guanylate cyclase domain-containing protein n=1 Tax=Prorocentrum cordatum TaxID=2364126 RepID=A0ABN9RZH3_9DINO|nr:unnamed protein product [Polarella glacialis]
MAPPRVAALERAGASLLLAAAAPACAAQRQEAAEQGPALGAFWTAALGSYALALLLGWAAWRLLRGWLRLAGNAGDTAEAGLARSQPSLEDLQRVRGKDMLGDADASCTAASLSQRSEDERSFNTKELRDYYEDAWLTASEERRYRTSATTFCAMAWLVLCFRCWCLYIDGTASCHGSIRWHWRLGELAGLLAVLAAVHCMRKRPYVAAYWAVLLSFAMYVPASTVPPLELSCTELVSRCAGTSDPYMKQVVKHLDCSLQGQSAEMLFMTVILLFPWLVPELAMMPVACAVVLTIYLSWTAAFEHFMAEDVFGMSQVVIRTSILCVAFSTTCVWKFFKQKTEQHMFLCNLERKESSMVLYYILRNMLPAHVLLPVLKREPVADKVPWATIMFVLMEDFQCLTRNTLQPSQLLRFLNQVFSDFDSICECYDVTKIESVGEEYVCAVGLGEEESSRAAALARLFLAAERMFLVAERVPSLLQEDVRLRMGMHTGPLVAGVIGNRLPRYRLFGDTVNTAARMMQKGRPGKLQFGEETRRDLPPCVVSSPRGLVTMKGKGDVMTYEFERIDHSKVDRPQDFLQEFRLQAAPGKTELVHVLFEAQAGQLQTGRKGFATLDIGWCVPVWSNVGSQSGASSSLSSDEEGSDGSDASTQDDGAVATAPFTAYQKGITASHDMRNFDRVIQQLTEKESSAMRAAMRGRLFLSEKSEFTEQMERDFQKWDRDNAILKKVGRRMATHIALFVVYTAAEISAILLHTHKVSLECWHGLTCWPLFLFLRSCALSIMFWLVVKASRGLLVSVEHPQLVLFMSYVAIDLLIAASYQVLVSCFEEEADVIDDETAFKKAYSAEEVFSIVFVLVHLVVMNAHSFNFSFSVGWMCVTVFVATCICLWNTAAFYTYGMAFFFIVNSVLNTVAAHDKEQGKRRYFKAQHHTENTSRRVGEILETLLPPLIIREVQEGAAQYGDAATRRNAVRNQPSHFYESATVAQSDLVGFTALAGRRTPAEVVTMLEEIFGRFDSIADELGVWKIETVGDAYIAAQAGAPLTRMRSPSAVVRFGAEMVLAVQQWSEKNSVVVTCRVGVHHGECIGGIVGVQMQRYHLFGDLITEVGVLESTAPENVVQVSGACRKAVVDEHALPRTPAEEPLPPVLAALSQTPRSESEPVLTSKGEEYSYGSAGGPTYLLGGPAAFLALCAPRAGGRPASAP